MSVIHKSSFTGLRNKRNNKFVCYSLPSRLCKVTVRINSKLTPVLYDLSVPLFQGPRHQGSSTEILRSQVYRLLTSLHNVSTTNALMNCGHRRERTKRGALLHGVPYGVPKWSTQKILFRMHTVDPCVSSISNSAYLSLNTHFKQHCSTVFKSKHPF